MENLRQKKVTLSTGQTVTVGRINWDGYVRIRTELFGLVKGPVGELLAKWLARDATAIGELTPDIMVLLPQAVPTLIELLNSNTVPFVTACLPKGEAVPGDIGAMDLLELRDACLELNDFRELFAKEKNSLAAAVGNSLKSLGSNPPTPTSSGGQGGSQN